MLTLPHPDRGMTKKELARRTWSAGVLVGEDAQAEDADTHSARDEHDGRHSACGGVCRAARHVLPGLWAQGGARQTLGHLEIMY